MEIKWRHCTTHTHKHTQQTTSFSNQSLKRHWGRWNQSISLSLSLTILKWIDYLIWWWSLLFLFVNFNFLLLLFTRIFFVWSTNHFICPRKQSKSSSFEFESFYRSKMVAALVKQLFAVSMVTTNYHLTTPHPFQTFIIIIAINFYSWVSQKK